MNFYLNEFQKLSSENKIKEFVSKVDIVTFEFENIPYQTLKKINEIKKVIPKPEINKTIQFIDNVGQ